jgi:hypothetical protein
MWLAEFPFLFLNLKARHIWFYFYYEFLLDIEVGSF